MFPEGALIKCFVIQWNLDLTTAMGPRKCARYIEGSLNGGSFSYYNFSGAEKFAPLYQIFVKSRLFKWRFHCIA